MAPLTLQTYFFSTMTSTRRLWIILTALALQAVGVCLLSAQAQSTTNSAPAINSTTNSSSAGSALTADERAQLRKVKKEVLAAHPDLKAQDDDLSQQRDDLDNQVPPATPDERKAFFAKWHDLQMKIRVEALKIDPTLAPIYAKLDAWRQQHPYPNNKPAGG